MVLKIQVVQFVWPARTSQKDIHWALGHPENTGSTHGSADTKALLSTGPPKKRQTIRKMGVYLHRKPSKKTKTTKKHPVITRLVNHPEFVPRHRGWIVRAITLKMHVQISSMSFLSSVVLPHQCVLLGGKNSSTVFSKVSRSLGERYTHLKLVTEMHKFRKKNINEVCIISEKKIMKTSLLSCS